MTPAVTCLHTWRTAAGPRAGRPLPRWRLGWTQSTAHHSSEGGARGGDKACARHSVCVMNHTPQHAACMHHTHSGLHACITHTATCMHSSHTHCGLHAPHTHCGLHASPIHVMNHTPLPPCPRRHPGPMPRPHHTLAWLHRCPVPAPQRVQEASGNLPSPPPPPPCPLAAALEARVRVARVLHIHTLLPHASPCHML